MIVYIKMSPVWHVKKSNFGTVQYTNILVQKYCEWKEEKHNYISRLGASVQTFKRKRNVPRYRIDVGFKFVDYF